jgi:glycosyltransferase involved in cell wall biosynthesis
MKNILFVTNMFPTDRNPFFGIFIKEQIEALKKDFLFKEEVYLINGLHKSKFEYLKSIFKIPYLIIKTKPDIVHIHYGISGLFLLFFKPKIPIYLTLHGCDFQEHGNNRLQVWISKLVAKRVSQIFVQNQEMKDLGYRINPNVEILTCGVDTVFFNPFYSNPVQFSNKVIIFPSDPERVEKNFPLFMKVIQKLQIENSITIKCIDKMNREEIRDLLSSADCLLMTSISEGSPQVVKEALSCGLPVVSVPVGNVAEMIEGVPNCFVSSSFNFEELYILVLKSLKGNKDGIRKKFLGKRIYDNTEIAARLSEFYHIPRKVQ